MPNWCSNHVIVEGVKGEVERFLRLASDGVSGGFSFDNVIPLPDDNDMSSVEQFKTTYELWGVKWDVDCDDSTFVLGEALDGGVEGNSVFEMFYETPWGPAENFWINVCGLFPSFQVTQQFFEEGNGFIGQTYARNGFIERVNEHLTDKHYVTAGAVFDDDGYVDYDASDDFSLWNVFPLTSE